MLVSSRRNIYCFYPLSDKLACHDIGISFYGLPIFERGNKMNPTQKQAFQLRPMAGVVPMSRDDIDFMLHTKARPSDWKNAQKVADDAINKASKATE